MKQNKVWFGDRQVTAVEKTRRVHGVFSNVAARYDLMNDVMSGSLHRLWKREFIRTIKARPGQDILDLAGGTGDIARGLVRKYQAHVTVCDLTEAMMQVGRDKSLDQGIMNDIEWVTGNAEDLPFGDLSFDHVTIAFGLRNVTHMDKALKEAFRVLKPGGVFHCLEFSKVTSAPLAKLYDVYSRHVIPALGSLIANDRGSYEYLVESIRRFPPQDELAVRMKQAGFDAVRYDNLTGGIVAIHRGVRT